MTNLIHRLASAIATQEGFFNKGSIPERYNNPGDLRAAPWINIPAIRNGYWVASSVEQGTAGLYHQIALDIARGHSLKSLIFKYAPPKDGNKTNEYLSNVAHWVGISMSDYELPLHDFIEPLDKLN